MHAREHRARQFCRACVFLPRPANYLTFASTGIVGDPEGKTENRG